MCNAFLGQMSYDKRGLRTDLIWLFALGTMTLLTIGLLIGFDNWRSKPFDIQFHDTYIILSIGQVFLITFYECNVLDVFDSTRKKWI